MIDPLELDPVVARTAEAMPVWMGGITKAVAVYAEPFWKPRYAGMPRLSNPTHDVVPSIRPELQAGQSVAARSTRA